MVDNKKFARVSARIDYLIEQCEFPNDAAFATAVGASSGSISNWRSRNSTGSKQAEKDVCKATGALLVWWREGEGEPFGVAGPTKARQSKKSLDGRFFDINNDILVLRTFIMGMFDAMDATGSIPASGVAEYFLTSFPDAVWQEKSFAKLALGKLDKAMKKAATQSQQHGNREASAKSKRQSGPQ